MRHGLRIVGNAIASLGPQVLALLVLAPGDFGAFSVPYLVFALGASLAISCAVDPWLMMSVAERSEPWRVRGFAGVVAVLAAAVAVAAAAATTLVVGDPVVAALAAVAAAASTMRSAERARATDMDSMRGVLGGDAAATVGLVGSAGILLASGTALTLAWVVACWCIAALASLLPSWPSLRPGLHDAGRWLRTHRHALPRLVADSILMDVGAIGTPFVLGGFLGVQALGIYRAISNVAAPVRLILAPLRPTLARAAWGWPRVLVVVGAGAALAGGAFLALALLDASGWRIGTLTAVAALAAPTAIFVGANFAGHAAYVVARVRATTPSLLVGRGVQTVTAVLGPIAGAVASGVEGAAWGLACATVLSASSWAAIAWQARRGA